MTTTNPLLRGARTALWLSAALMLAACGMRSSSDKTATQVAARVNTEEISVHQINFVLQRQPGLKADQAQAAGRQVLERLIDQEIAVQKAQADKLDRDPAVVQEIEAARREILARAYLARVGEGAERPTADEIKAYYTAKPGLFAERRIYTLQEIQVQAEPARITALQQALASAKSLKDVSDYLNQHGLPVRVTQNTAPAENLPMSLVDRLHGMKEGQTVFTGMPGGARLVTIMKAEAAPIGEDKAQPVIERFLRNERRKDLVEKEVKALRASAQVEYVGDFASAAPGAQDAPSREAATAAPAAASGGLDASTLDKGLSGLK